MVSDFAVTSKFKLNFWTLNVELWLTILLTRSMQVLWSYIRIVIPRWFHCLSFSNGQGQSWVQQGSRAKSESWNPKVHWSAARDSILSPSFHRTPSDSQVESNLGTTTKRRPTSVEIRQRQLLVESRNWLKLKISLSSFRHSLLGCRYPGTPPKITIPPTCYWLELESELDTTLLECLNQCIIKVLGAWRVKRGPINIGTCHFSISEKNIYSALQLFDFTQLSFFSRKCNGKFWQ